MDDREPPRVTLASVLAQPDYFPVALDRDAATVHWQDVGDCPFSESVFVWSLQAWAEQRGLGEVVQTDLSELADANLEFDAVAPGLFIFHMSRCGSSLLARSLAADPRTIVMSELPAINVLLRHLTGGELNRLVTDADDLRVLRHLIAAPGRRRRGDEARYAVKFSSWNVLQIQSIRAAWPEVPTVFLYRDPAEVLASLVEGPPGWAHGRLKPPAVSMTGVSRQQLEDMNDLEFVVRCLGNMMEMALTQPDVMVLNYTDLQAGSLSALMQRFGMPCSDAELAVMSEPFALHTKTPGAETAFVPDSGVKQAALEDWMRALVEHHLLERYSALERSDRNLRPLLQ